MTDYEGRAEASVPSDTSIVLIARAPGHTSFIDLVHTTGVGRAQEVIHIALPRAAVLRGAVRDESEAPVAGAIVYVSQDGDDGVLKSEASDERGIYEVHGLLPGVKYAVYTLGPVNDARRRSATAGPVCAASVDDDIVIDLVLQDGSAPNISESVIEVDTSDAAQNLGADRRPSFEDTVACARERGTLIVAVVNLEHAPVAGQDVLVRSCGGALLAHGRTDIDGAWYRILDAGEVEIDAGARPMARAFIEAKGIVFVRIQVH
jgi:hypothetical protein